MDALMELFKNFPFLLLGAWETLKLTAFSVGIGVILGTFIGMGRLSKIKLISYPCTAYVEFLRGTPLLVQDTVNQFSENRAIILLNSKKGYHPPLKEAIPNVQMSSLWFFQLLQKRTFSRWFSTISLQILSQDLPPFFFQKA